jgi:hypothetical protein
MLINPGFMEQYAAMTVAQMKEDGATAAEIASRQAEMQRVQWLANPVAMGLFYFVETALIGTILSLIVALLMRTKHRSLP